MPDWIGYRWLIERFGLTVTQALRTETVIGSTRATVSNGTTERRTVLEQLRPEASLAGHLSFALKHEGVHLEALSHEQSSSLGDFCDVYFAKWKRSPTSARV